MTPCYQRHEIAPGIHADIPHEHDTAKEPTMCEAEERNMQALYILENEWGCGRIDVSELQRILRGETCDHEGT